MESPADRGPVVDVLYAIDGTALPAEYRFELLGELTRCLPWLDAETGVGIHPLKAARDNEGCLLLPRRAKLVMRLPERHLEAAGALTGQELRRHGWTLRVGARLVRKLVPHGTLYAYLVAAESDDEQVFTADIGAQLGALEIPCKVVCGRRQSFSAGDRLVAGYSLMLHALTPEHSLRLQQVGLGGDRLLGCGIFVPHRSAAAVGAG